MVQEILYQRDGYFLDYPFRLWYRKVAILACRHGAESRESVEGLLGKYWGGYGPHAAQ